MESDHTDRGKHKSQGTSRVEGSDYIGVARNGQFPDMILHSTDEQFQARPLVESHFLCLRLFQLTSFFGS